MSLTSPSFSVVLELGHPGLCGGVELGELLEPDCVVDVDFVDLYFEQIESLLRITGIRILSLLVLLNFRD